MALRTALPGCRDKPVASGTVVSTVADPVGTRAYAVGALSRAVGTGLLLVGLVALALARFTPLTTSPWLLVAVITGLACTLAALSVGVGATGWWSRLGAAFRRAASPRPVPMRGPVRGRRLAQARCFDLLGVDGTRVTCEVLGPPRRRSPKSGQLADVYGECLDDGRVRVRRVVYAVDGVEFRPRADLGFSIARITTGVATVAGGLLTVAALAAMTIRHR